MAWKIDPDRDGKYILVGRRMYHDGNIEYDEGLGKKMEANIQYIIRIDNKELSTSAETGKSGESILIKVAEGYNVSSISGGTAQLTKNTDGTYTLVVPAGGGVEVSAVLEAVSGLSNDKTDSAKIDSTNKTNVIPGQTGKTATIPLSKQSVPRTAKSSGTSSSKSTRSSTSIGTAQNGWKDVGEKRYYYEDGTMETGWAEIKGNTYYFDEDGVMQTGWVEIEDKWYYFDEDGIMQTGWLTLDDKTYYLDKDGVLVTGKQTIDGEDYEFDDDGVLISNKAD